MYEATKGKPLKCLDCDKYARWHVWYKGFSSPTQPPFVPANIAYNSLCDEHAVADLINGREGWQAECIKLVDERRLPINDRATVNQNET